MSVKFGFKKTAVKPLAPAPKFRQDESRETKEFVHYISGSQIKGHVKNGEEKRKAELVIPLIQANRWRNHEKLEGRSGESKTNGLEKKLEDQAINEIMESTKAALEKDPVDRGMAISLPLLLQNRIPTGFETDDNMDVSLRPEESTLDDYERVPIEEFGLAMLRGMGWTKTEGIGLKNKKVVDMREPQLRQKGLGLGAERPQRHKDPVPQSHSSKDHKDREVLSLKIGAFLLITRGTHENNYGQVSSFDEDNNRVIVKLANSSKMAAVSKFYITLVSEREFSNNTRDSKRSKR